MLHWTSRGPSDRTHSVVAGTYAIRECFGWTAGLEEHTSNADDMAVLCLLCHRKRRAKQAGYMLCLGWYASCLQKSSSPSSGGSRSKPQEYGWCLNSHIKLVNQAVSVAGQVWWKLTVLCAADLVSNDVQMFCWLRKDILKTRYTKFQYNNHQAIHCLVPSCTIFQAPLMPNTVCLFVCFLIIWNPLCSFLWKGKYCPHCNFPFTGGISKLPLDIMQKMLFPGCKPCPCPCPWLSPARAVHFFSHVQMILSVPRELRIQFFLMSAMMLDFPN